MAHFQQQKFVAEVKSHFPQFFKATRVLEVGSWICNDTVRTHFQSCDYLGTDVAAGSGVDLVVAGQDLALPTASFDVVISCECFEHNPFWRETFLNMMRVLRPGGLFVLTCATTGRGEHGTTRTTPGLSLTALEQHPDYYRNLSQRDFERAIALHEYFSHYLFVTNRYSKDLYFAGCRASEAPDPALADRMASLRRAARRIKLVQKPTLLRTFAAHAEWWLKWAFVGVVGEATYHQVRHLLRPRSSPPNAVVNGAAARDLRERRP